MSYKPRYFSPYEFERIGCHMEDVNEESLRRLDRARAAAGIPFVLTSAYRTVAHELEMGRSGYSAHTRGRAFDISCQSDLFRHKIVQAAMQVGFCRIGIAKNFVHIDDDVEHLPWPRIWLY